MAINAYIGLPGFGKTIEVVENVVIPAIKKGRRVITNISGLDQEKVYDYIEQTKKENEIFSMGEIVIIETERIKDSNFFITQKTDKDGENKTILQPGDILVVDEAWAIWGIGNKIPESHHDFFRTHRHYSSADNGFTCDIVLISQDLGVINRNIKSLIEQTFSCNKHKSLGFTKYYRVDVYMKANTSKKYLTNSYQKKYNSKIYELYKSYNGDDATETVIDKRQNIFTSKKFIFTVLFGLCLVIFLLPQAIKTLNPKPKDKKVFIPQDNKLVVPKSNINERYKYSTSSPSEAQIVIKSDRVIGYYSSSNCKKDCKKNILIQTKDGLEIIENTINTDEGFFTKYKYRDKQIGFYD